MVTVPISVPRQPLKLIDRVSAINWNRLEDEKDWKCGIA